MTHHGLDKFYTLVDALTALPSVGKKSATRLALHIVQTDPFGGMKLASAIEEAIQFVKKCQQCGNISEHELCEICSDEQRNDEILCIVSSAKDILAIEETASYHGKYFVFDGIDPQTIYHLEEMVKQNVHEILFAFTPSVASDTMIYYIEDKLSSFGLTFTKIAQGVPTGVNFENIDTISLARALQSRISI